MVYLSMEEKQSAQMTTLLSIVLANEFALQGKTKKIYWAFSGERFATLQQLLKEQCNEMEEAINEVARRIRKLGGKTYGSVREFTALTVLRDQHFTTSPREMIKELMDNHQAVIDELKKNVQVCAPKDRLIISFLNWLIQQHENISWILGSYLNQFPVWLHSSALKKIS